MNAKHPEQQALSDYITGKLDEQLAAVVETHVAECPECEVTLQAIEANSETLVAGLREPEKSPTEVFAREAEYQRAIDQAANLPEVTAIHGQPTTASAALPSPTGEQPLQKLGPYELLAKLGEGGMGAVYKAQHEHLGKTVAIKILPAAAMRDPALVGRFRREMKAVGALHHPNIVGAHDAGEAGGVHFLVMEYVAGKDLSTILKEIGPLPVEQAISCTLQAARGLEFAHRKGIVHRDIKPANLLLDEEGTLKILDMGLARLDDNAHNLAAQEGLTQTGQVMGTVDYMAPEQAFDTHRADSKADVYSLGCTLYRILTGQNAYVGETIVQKILAHREKPIPSLRDTRPEVPVALDKLFQRMMAKNADERIGMSEVVQELAALQSAPAVPATKSFKLPQAPAAVATPHAVQSGGGQKKIPGVWLAAGFGAAAALILLAVVYIIRDKDGNEIARVTGPDGSSVTVQPEKSPEKNVATPAVTPTQQANGKRFTNKFGMEFSLVPAGKSWLGGGDGKPGTIEYTQPHDFYLGTFEVTQQEWQRVMRTNPSTHRRGGKFADKVKEISDEDLKRFPVEYVSPNDCFAFLEKLNEQSGETGWIYRLPTLAEWEYACRGGPLTDPAGSAFYYYFDQPGNAIPLGKANTGLDGPGRPMKVGSFPPNSLGLYDMHGNIAEHLNDDRPPNPNDPEMQLRKAVASGGFHHKLFEFRASPPSTGGTNLWMRTEFTGLRVARVPVDAAPKIATDGNNPAFEQWVKSTAALPPQQQLEAFSKKMIELNPGFDGKLTGGYGDAQPKIEHNALVSVGFSSEFVSDIRPVRVFAKLKKLQCRGTNLMNNVSLLSDLSPLAGMRLILLDCSFTKIQDLAPLKGMPLENLMIVNNPIDNLAPLSGMRLTSISMNNCWKVLDLTPLRGMPLTNLSANGCLATDFSFLSGMPLKNLSLHGTKFHDLELLKGMPLEGLDLGRTEITDIAKLANFTKLSWLDLKQMKLNPADVTALQAKLPNCKIEWDAPPEVLKQPEAVQKFAFEQPDFAAWAAEVGRRDPETQLAMLLKKLQELNPGFDGQETHQIKNNDLVELNLPAAKIADLSPVRALTELKILKCVGKEEDKGLLKSLAPLAGMKLERLECYYTDVADLAPLRGMPLRHLICFGTRVTDLGPLAGMPLETLWVYYNKELTDLSPLRGTPLKTLSCSATGIEDLSPLADCPLNALTCQRTKVKDLGPLRGKELTQLDISFTKVSDLAPLETCTKLRKLGIEGLSLPAEAVEKLQKVLPDCMIKRDAETN